MSLTVTKILELVYKIQIKSHVTSNEHNSVWNVMGWYMWWHWLN